MAEEGRPARGDPAVLEMLAAARAGQQDREDARDRLKAVSRARLSRIVETKIRTAFIAPLAQIEECFGVLWGGKRPEQMDERERRWWDAYQAAREKILTNGNNQIRAVQSEVLLYEIEWKGYRNRLPVVPQRTE